MAEFLYSQSVMEQLHFEERAILGQTIDIYCKFVVVLIWMNPALYRLPPMSPLLEEGYRFHDVPVYS